MQYSSNNERPMMRSSPQGLSTHEMEAQRAGKEAYRFLPALQPLPR